MLGLIGDTIVDAGNRVNRFGLGVFGLCVWREWPRLRPHHR